MAEAQREVFFSDCVMPNVLQPVQIMEGALARKLRSRPAVGKRGLTIVIGEHGGVRVVRGQEILGTWKWTGNNFGFTRSVNGPVEFVTETLMGASFYTSRIFLE